MKLKKRIAGALISAMLTFPYAAMAAQASITVSGVTIDLVDLDMADGVAPSITFGKTEGYAWLEVKHLPWPATIYSTHSAMGAFGNTSQWAAISTNTSLNGVSASAQTLEPTVTANTTAISQLWFTLSKNTMAVFNIPYAISLTKGSNEFASSRLDASAWASGSSFDNHISMSSGTLSRALYGEVHTGDETSPGSLILTAAASAQSSIAPPVPEPGTYAMLLAGLGVIGWRMRQRNSAAG